MKILGWIIATPLILLALYAVLRFAFCRPSYFTVKTATPMVKKIADHIVAHGIPESLEQIPDLPYELKGCKRTVRYRKLIGVSYEDIDSKDDADFAIIEENCSFYPNQKIGKVSFRFSPSYKYPDRTDGKLRIKSDKTSVGVSFNTDKNNKLTYGKVGTGFDNRFGFCRQFKQ